METGMVNMKVFKRSGLLYPMLVVAAVAVIIFSAVGVATMTGFLPRAESMNGAPWTAESNQPAASSKQPASNQPAASNRPAVTNQRIAAKSSVACADCGVVESIAPVESKGTGSGLGMVAGGVTGALLGNQIGRGNGNAVATIAGAAGGAFAGNEIEKNMKKTVRYQVRVRMQDGTTRTSYQSSAPGFSVGDKVKIVNGQVVASS